jgi:hypothetical protein
MPMLPAKPSSTLNAIADPRLHDPLSFAAPVHALLECPAPVFGLQKLQQISRLQPEVQSSLAPAALTLPRLPVSCVKQLQEAAT